MAAAQFMSLVDYAAHIAGCPYVSDLHHPDAIGKHSIAHALEKVGPDTFSLRDWTDAAEYFTGAKTPCTSAGQARTALIAALTSSHFWR